MSRERWDLLFILLVPVLWMAGLFSFKHAVVGLLMLIAYLLVIR